MAFCGHCGAQIQDNAVFCGACGNATTAANPGPATPMAAPPVAAANPGLADNVAGLLAYLFVPAIVFLVVEPYNKKPFIRFHSFQSIFLALAWFAVDVVVGFVLVPFMWMFAHMLLSLLGLVMFVLWLFLMFKAYQGQMFKLPIIGDMALKQANSI